MRLNISGKIAILHNSKKIFTHRSNENVLGKMHLSFTKKH